MISTKVSFKLLTPMEDVYHLRYANQRDLTQSMMRLQEYYEGVSKDIRGRYFTLEQFLHQFTDADGGFYYTQIWGGFNVPGEVVERWAALFKPKDGLTDKENQLLDAIMRRRKGKSGKWYLIATSGERDQRTLNHELAHARYYLDSDYRSRCDALTAEMPKRSRKRMEKVLLKMGYNTEVLPDEIQAYLSTSTPKDLSDRFGFKDDNCKQIIKAMKANFRG